MTAKTKKETLSIVYVAMSGGVDSSVAAALLKNQGFHVVGIFMKPWQLSGVVCQWQQDREDALQVASRLDIELLTWDFGKEYGKSVAEPMIAGYRDGRTPNPDVECNRLIKFGLFYKKALAEGADYVATGHYARIVKKEGRRWLAAAKDESKDQTYFLWGIESKCLEKTLFPIGEYEKSEVRAIAEKKKLSVASKKDSQGVCFVGDIDFLSFLKRNIPPRSGNILDTTGTVIGQHEGAPYYTIGQRHGLGLPGGTSPQYVVSKNIRSNTITVGSEDALLGTSLNLSGTNWFGEKPKSGSKVSVKIRYRTKAVRATIGTRGKVVFSHPVRAISPGQSAVIYRGRRVLGGGIIAL